jgi:hypothetical protein
MTALVDDPRREVIRPRIRVATRVARGALVLAVIAVGAAIPVVSRHSQTPDVIVESFRIPLVVPMITTTEPPLRTTPPRRIGCSLPISQIGLVGDKYLHSRSPAGLTGVAASATGCTIAIWGARDAYVSRDDGASFARFAGEESRAADPWAARAGVAVAVGADETVYLVRSGRLELELRDGTVREHALPDASFDRIHVSSRWLVVRSRDRLAASDDAGLTWKIQPLPAAMTAAAIRFDDDGAMHLAAAAGANDPVTYHRGHVRGGPWTAVWTSPPHRPYTDPYNPSRGDPYSSSIDAFAFGSDGQLYAEHYDAHGHRLFVVSPSGATTTAAKLPSPSVLRGVAIVGPAWGPVTRDAHGLVLTIVEGRGPVRTSDQLDRLMTAAWSSGGRGRGRWLVGGVVP